MTFQERLKELRKEDGITQKTLAEAIGTTCDCIGFWEHGRSEPSIEFIIALAKYFGVRQTIYSALPTHIEKKALNECFFVAYFFGASRA